MAISNRVRQQIIGWVGQKGYDILFEEGDAIKPGLGPEDDHWEDWRRTSLPTLHRVFQWFDGYATYPLREREYAGTIADPPEAVEETLWEQGLCRNPLAALKTDPLDNTEVGSWMYREDPTAERQVHVMLFRIGTGDAVETDLYAHKEYAAGHPDPEIAVKHYNAEDYSPAAGVGWVQEHLPVEERPRFE